MAENTHVPKDLLDDDFDIEDVDGLLRGAEDLLPKHQKILDYVKALPDDKMKTSRMVIQETGVSRTTLYTVPLWVKDKYTCKHKSSIAKLWGNERRVAWYKERFGE